MTSTQKNMKCTWPTPEFCVGTQRNLYSTGLRLGFASGKMQILGFASGKTQIRGFALATRYQHVGIPNAKFWRRGYCPTPTPNARNVASQGNRLYRGCGFPVFRSCGSHSERNLVVRFSIEVYGSKTLFSLLFSKYWS